VSLERCWSGKNFGILIVSFIVFKIYFNIYMDIIYTIIQQTIFVQYTKTTLQTFKCKYGFLFVLIILHS